jgi:SAM-dependent methyltransferase
MAHEAQNRFFRLVKDQYPEYFKDAVVLEVGSLDINGSVRSLFENCAYTGVDVGPGPGVDLVMGGEELRFRNDVFDTTVSAECFEHNPYWRETFENMVRMTIPNGLVIFTCASEGRPEHGTARSDPASSPLTLGWDYYKNLNEQDFDFALGVNGKFHYNSITKDLYFYGIKPYEGGETKGLKDLEWETVPWTELI